MRTILASIGISILQSVAQTVWESLWAVIFSAVEEAEQNWIQAGRGEVKKEWAIQHAMIFLESKKVVKWYNNRFIERALGLIFDRIITDLNGRFGKNWIGKMSDVKQTLAGRIPFFIK